jgi:glyoxylate utilization-related uncharacterized protein
MPNTSADDASIVYKIPGWEGRYENWSSDNGGISVGFETYDADIDWTEPLKQLPEGQCMSPHAGYCIEGKVAFIIDGKEETYQAGEAFYVPAGHTTKTFADSKAVYFSPTDKLQAILDTFGKMLGA